MRTREQVEQEIENNPGKEREIFAAWYQEMAVGDHCSIHMYSDIIPCTVIARTKATITVRHDKARALARFVTLPQWRAEYHARLPT